MMRVEVIAMTIEQKIKQACTFANISVSELARRIGTTPQNLNQRLKVGKFTSAELEKIASALGAVSAITFTFPDGTVF